jgi:hypothetical protein
VDTNEVLISVKCVYMTNSGILTCQGLVHGFKSQFNSALTLVSINSFKKS